MRRWHLTVTAVVAVVALWAVATVAQQRAESRDMTLLGSNDLQARSAYQPVIQKQGNRYIAYVGQHAGAMPTTAPIPGSRNTSRTSPVVEKRKGRGRRRWCVPAAVPTCRKRTRASSTC